MKYRCFIALILTCLTATAALAQGKQEPDKRQSLPAPNNKQIIAEEIRQAREVADRFIKRFRETRDLTPLVDEMFASDFKKLIREDTSWSGTVGVGRSLADNLNAEERVRCFIVAFSLEYIIRLYVTGKIPLESNEPLQNVWSPEIDKFFRDNEPRDGNIRTPMQARNYLAFLERALVVMQKEVLKNPPEETEQFKKNLAAFEKHLQEHKEEQPAVWISTKDEHGRAAGTLFAKFVIPFHVGLVMVKENGQYKIWLALSTLPPD
jgi:hypothetical protein